MTVEALGLEERALVNDLSGRRFGRLLVLRETAPHFYLCRCDCGAQVVWRDSLLLSGYIRSCGCARGERNKRDLCGQRSGMVQILEPTAERRRGAVLWRCRCDCGKEFLTEGYKVSSGLIHSCGCAAKKPLVKAAKAAPKVPKAKVPAAPAPKGPRKNNTSGHTGVVLCRGKWRAQICYKGRHYSLGTYADIRDAVEARSVAEARRGLDFLHWYRGAYPNNVPMEQN